ncbi:MAG: outer membrane beta-barrel protein, partial [Sandaracinobacteroides sp.]
SPRVELRLNPALAVFAGASYTDTKSLEPPAGLARDSTGVLATAGLAGDILPLLTGEIEAGWRSRNYSSVQFSDFGGAVVQARLDWYPTPLTSLALRAGQDFENSGIIDVPSILARRIELDAFHEFRRNLLLNARIGYRHDRFREIDASATTVEASLRAELRFSSIWAAAGRISWRDRRVSDPQALAGFSGVQASLGLEARL